MLSIDYSLMYKIIEILRNPIQRIQINPYQFCIKTLTGHDDYFSSQQLHEKMPQAEISQILYFQKTKKHVETKNNYLLFKRFIKIERLTHRKF